MTQDLTPEAVAKMLEGVTPGPWFRGGVRIKMDRSDWHGILRYDEVNKRDEGIAAVGYDPRTGLGLKDADFIAYAREAVPALAAKLAEVEAERGDTQAMHRRAQIVEGKLHRTVTLLDVILETMKLDMKPPRSANLHSYFHNIVAARDHVRVGSGRAFTVAWGYFDRKRKETEARAEAAEAEVARLREALKPFARIADVSETAEPGESVIVNVDRCRAARAALAAWEAGNG
jgi:hypothetical protein